MQKIANKKRLTFSDKPYFIINSISEKIVLGKVFPRLFYSALFNARNVRTRYSQLFGDLALGQSGTVFKSVAHRQNNEFAVVKKFFKMSHEFFALDTLLDRKSVV